MPPKFKRTFSLEEASSSSREETAVLLEHKSGSEDEDFFLNGPSGKANFGNQDDERVRQVQAQIAEVTGVMRDNVGKILERGDQLESLRGASERLSATSYDFQSASARIKRRAWAQHMKIRAIIVALSILVIIGILDPAFLSTYIHLKYASVNLVAYHSRRDGLLSLPVSLVPYQIPIIVHYSS